MRHLSGVDQRWINATGGSQLVAGRLYNLLAGTTITLVDIGQGAQIQMRPAEGETWASSTTSFTYPTGWTLVAGAGLNATRIATLICDTANTKFTIYA